MDITSGVGLVNAIAEVINREDLNATIPSWIRMAEAGFSSTLRVRQMVRRSTTAASTRYVQLPDDFLQMKSVRIDDPLRGPIRLTLSSEDSIADPRLRGTWVTEPRFFTIVGNELELSPFKDPAPNTLTVEMTYFGQLPQLDLITPGATTWLLQRSPHVYLYAALGHSAPYLVEDERLQMWAQLAGDAIQTLNTEYEQSRTAGSNLREVRKTVI